MNRKPRSGSHDSSRDSRSYSIESFSSAFSSSEDLTSLEHEEKPIQPQTKRQNYMETTPRRRKRESGCQTQSKSPSVEHVLHKIFRNKASFLERFKKGAE